MAGIFWAPPVQKYPGVLPDRTDILVIGGGIAGTSLMHHLAKRRFTAVLVESRHLAFGASGRNAGFLLAGVADCYAEAVRIFGRSKAREVWHITDENHDRMIEAVAGSDVGHRRLGSATFASGEEERARLEESAQMLRDDPAGISANARLDALLRRGSARWHRVDRQLRRRVAALHAAGRDRGSGGHDAGQAR